MVNSTPQIMLKSSQVCKLTGVRPGHLIEASIRKLIPTFVNDGVRFYREDDLALIKEQVVKMAGGVA